ncbi:hypothetical protein PTTW11_04093 [Pyrenophora teres f. teres]|uniref:Uncharacterized protein n=1 Tax=Pyrenophora teres f. teres TaxID=97479 RepID=A0A6S6VYG1_9PLEO|nr:hypothetical protein PTTW11_04093 [Pyrenophora teres f. teres]
MHFKYLFAVLATIMTTASAANDLCYTAFNCQLWANNNCGIPNGGAGCHHPDGNPQNLGHCMCA